MISSMRCCLGVLLLVAASGCFGPDPAEGLPCSSDGECPDGQGCDQISFTCSVNPRSSCEAPTSACGTGCADLATDPDNCGACGTVCDVGQVCSNGTCSSGCADGLSECDGSCVDLSSDDLNCNGCGNSCDDPDTECRDSQCQLRCDAFLESPVPDSWGASWDGLEREAATLDVARAECEAFGGRLPTATELFRVSAAQSGAVGNATHTNYLWSLAPFNALEQVLLRLSDGATSNAAATGTQSYRCICPEDQFVGFTGSNCYGDAGAECMSLVNDYQVDTRDRPVLRKNSAVWECAFDGGHIAGLNQFVDAIQKGANGSGQWQWIGDEAGLGNSTLGIWFDDESSSFVSRGGNNGASGFSWSPTTTPRAFRCAGPRLLAADYPQNPTGAFASARFQVDSNDRPLGQWPAISDICVAEGGHVPTSTELAEVIQAGLPNGSNEWLYTSDQTGYDGGNFTLAIERWTGVDSRYFMQYTANLSWSYKATNRPFRCIYYPIDPAYVAPTGCNGGCIEFDLGGSGAKMWFDQTDRAAVVQHEAQAACTAAGGQLASERDFTEAIRLGLPNGSFEYLGTSDFSIGSNGNARQVQVVRWQGNEGAPTSLPGDMAAGIDRGYTDRWFNNGANAQTWGAVTTAHPYRCMWTNEVR